MRWLRIPRVIGVVVCLYLLAVTVFFWYQTALRFRFVNDARSVTGTVVTLVPRPLAGATRMPDSRGRNLPQAPQVRYVVDGRSYDYTPDHGSIGNRLRPGDRVIVLYDPSAPGRARLQGEGRLLLPLITASFATATVGVAVVLFLTRRTEPRIAVRRRVSVTAGTESSPG